MTNPDAVLRLRGERVLVPLESPLVRYLALLLLAVLQPARPADLVITGRMHHLRSGGEREWAEFPAQAEGAQLVRTFEATSNEHEQTLRLRHRDLKQHWRVVVNGSDIARLPIDEADMITFWTLPPQTLRDGTNELRIHGSATASDDVMVGEVSVIRRSRRDVLSDATLDVSVHDHTTGRAVPSRVTVADDRGRLVSVANVSDRDHAVRPGVIYTRTGAVQLTLPAGRYVVYAGRGFEYSVAKATLVLAPGDRQTRRLTIQREVDTSGWAAMDTHVHTATYARHGDASVEERMLTIAGEGIELPVSTEHNTRIDFDAGAREAGVRKYFTPLLGSEVTTPSAGHFNVFGLAHDGPAIDHRAPDWQRLRDTLRTAARDAVVVLNHGRDVHGGFRPLGPARHISIAGEDLDGWVLPANAMEVINSGAVMTDALTLPRDWMGMLNRGVMLAPIGSSDSHDVSRYIIGQGRTYVRCDDRDPGAIDVARAIENVRRGQVMVSYGLLTEIDVNAKEPGELARAAKDLLVRLRVKGPAWTRADRVALYVNGAKVREEEIRNGTRPGVKWEATWRLPVPAHDVHLVAIAMGPGVIAPYWPTAKPYQPTSIEFSPYVMGVSGAIFVDADANGRFESAFEYAQREVSAAKDEAAALVTRLASYDSAVAIQAASVLRAQSPSAFEARIAAMMQAAPPHVATGLAAYLNGWREATAARARSTR